MKKISKIITLLVLRSLRVAGCLSALVVCINLSAATRIAIVSENGGKLSDLLTAELSNVDGVELLDRSEIRKVLKEHKISAQMLDSKQALKLNKLLKTDLFVVIESEKKSQKAIGLVVFDANTGVRYWDSALPENDIDKTVEFAVNAVKQALGKRDKALEGKLKYISLLGVRNADLPRDKDPFCKAVGILLMRKLGNSPDIAVLERNHLDWLNKERNLPGMQWANELLSSNIIMELELSKTNGKIQALLLLPDKKQVKIVKEGNAIELASALALKLAKKGIPNIQFKFEIKQEAKRYFTEYAFLKGHDKWFAAHEKISNAYGLAPEKYRKQYTVSLLDCAIESICEKGHSHSYQRLSPSVKQLTQALDYAENSFYDYYLPNFSEKNPLWGDYKIYKFQRHLKSIYKLERYDKELQNRVNSFMGDLRKQKKIKLKAYYLSNNKNLYDKKGYKNRILYACHITDLNEKESVKLLFEENLPVVYTWLEDTTKFIEKKGLPAHSRILKEIAFSSNRNLHFDLLQIAIPPHKSLTPDNKKELLKIFKKMENHPSPSFRFIGLSGKILLSTPGLEGEEHSPQKLKTIEKIVELWKKEIRKIDIKGENQLEREFLYDTLSNILHHYPVNRKTEDKLQLELFRFMIKEGELHYWLIHEVLNDAILNDDPEQGKDCFNDLDALLAEGNFVIYSSYRKEKGLREMIAEKRAAIPGAFTVSSDNLPWTKVQNFYSNKLYAHPLINIFLRDKDIYSVSAVQDNVHTWHLELLKFSLNNIEKKPVSISKMHDFPDGTVVYYGPLDRKDFCAKSTISDNNIFTGTKRAGVIIFPLDGSQPTRLHKGTGLPANYVQSCVWAEGKLYIALGKEREESFIVSYDPKSKSVETIASSQKKEKQTPFDNVEKPFYVRQMIHDKEKGRILLLIDFTNIYPFPKVLAKMRGMWEFNIKNGQWKQLIHLPDNRIQARRYGNKLLLFEGDLGDWCAEFDLKTDKSRLLAVDKRHLFMKKSFPESSPIVMDEIPRGAYLELDNKLWTGMPFGYISLETGKQKLLPHINKQHHFRPWNYIVLDNGKRVLISEMYGLWLVDLKDDFK